MIKGSVQEEDITIISIYAPNIGRPKYIKPILLYPARISFRFNGEIKTFTDKQKLREFSITRPAKLRH